MTPDFGVTFPALGFLWGREPEPRRAAFTDASSVREPRRAGDPRAGDSRAPL